MQIINNFLKLSLLFLLNLTLALADNDNLVVYDLSYMVNQGKYILPLPEIKIKFDELGEQFKAGDKLYIRMTSESEELSSPTWFYPIVHDKSEPITKRMLKYLTKLSLDARVDHIPFRGKIIPLPKLRIMSGDILGSARSKVSSVYQFEPENSEKLEIDFLKDIEQNDLLRLNGLFLGVSEHREISKTSFEYRRNNGNWSPLNIYNILVGSTKISSIGETRLLRLKNHEYDLSVALETGKYSSLRGGDKLKLKLSDSFNCEWVNSGPQTIRVEFEPEVDSFKVVPVIIGKEINFQVKNGNYDKARLTFPDLKVRCLSSDSELLSSGSISLYSDLSSTELFEDKDQYLTLGNISEPISLMNPRMKLVGGDFRSFYRTDTTCMVDLLVNLEKGSILYPGDTIKIILPEIYSIRWDYVVAENPNLFKVININQKTLGVIIQEKVINTLNLNSLAIALPHKSIPPFNLKVVYPFLKSNHEQLVQNDLRFGHIDIKLAESQMLNTAGKKAHLKRITVQEDSIGKILRRGDVIEVIGRQDAFDFDLEKLNEIIILDNSESNVTKIAINYSSCTESKIVFNILIPFELGEEIFIDNIPVYNLQNFVKNVHLTYRINTGNIYSDINQVNLIRANAKFENENKFIRDVNAKPQILALQNLNINLVNIPNYINGGQFLALRLPREFFRWAANQNPILKPSDLFTVEYFSDDELVISTKGVLPDSINLSVAGLRIIPQETEFVSKELECVFVNDPHIRFRAIGNISYTFPSFMSIKDQTFFTDDSTWDMYEININTGNLDVPILPGAHISIVLSDKSIWWDNTSKISQLTENHNLLSEKLLFDKNICHIVASDTIWDNTLLKISGLRIRPVAFPLDRFTLQMSLDGGQTICAKDYNGLRYKTIKSKDEYSEKVNRAIIDNIFSMESGKTISIRIPDEIPFVWDENEDILKKVTINSRMDLQKGDINISVLDQKVSFSDSKTAVLKIKHGYGSIDQGLRLSGSNRKKLYFRGLRMKSLSNDDTKPDWKGSLYLIIQTPYGYNSENDNPTGWKLLINGQRENNFSLNNLEDMEYTISTPQVSKYDGKEVYEDTKLQLYAEEKVLLWKPLLEFKYSNTELAQHSLENTLSYIVDLYDDTDPKGKNWKTWYYLAWLKKRAAELNILEEIQVNRRIKDIKSLRNSTYDEDMKKARNKGYDPTTRHLEYPSIKMGDQIAEINDNIDTAVEDYRSMKFLDAEQKLLVLKRGVRSDEKLKYLDAKIDYWLARIAISLGDSEYDSYQQSYAFLKLRGARRVFMNNEPLFTRDYWLGDSIKVYGNIARNQVSQINYPINNELKVSRRENPNKEYQDASVEFYYIYDFSYTMDLQGIGGSSVAILDPNDNTNLMYSKGRTSLDLDQTLKFNKGGEYELKFSPYKQTLHNIIISVFLFSTIAIIYE